MGAGGGKVKETTIRLLKPGRSREGWMLGLKTALSCHRSSLETKRRKGGREGRQRRVGEGKKLGPGLWIEEPSTKGRLGGAYFSEKTSGSFEAMTAGRRTLLGLRELEG